MKNLKKLLSVLLLMCSTVAAAHDFEVDGIFYNITDETAKTVEVTYQGAYSNEYYYEYSGKVIIPSTVTHNGVTYEVTRIGDEAFLNCTFLNEVVIPTSVKVIGKDVFKESNNVSKIHIDDLEAWCGIEFDNVIETPLGRGYSLYVKGELVTDLVIPDGVTVINPFVFSGCLGLKSIEFPASVTSIGKCAFELCQELKNVRIPGNVKSVGGHSFSYCTALTGVTFEEGVTGIGDYAFFGCKALDSVTIPVGVASIGDGAFSNRDGIGTVYSFAAVPPATTSHCFTGSYDTATLYVPLGAYEAYRSAMCWEYFTNIVEMQGTGIEDVKGESESAETVYDLSGKKVGDPEQGIYIINGKKVLVK